MDYNDIEILLVEDSKDDALLTMRAFKKSGFANKLYHVKDGVEAINFLYRNEEFMLRNKENPKLILLDLKMPKMSGLEVLAKIKTDLQLRAIPVVVLTSSKEDPDIQKCYALGANSYMVKPVESDNFYNMIKEIGLYWMTMTQLPN